MAQGAAIDRAAASDLSGHSRDAALLTLDQFVTTPERLRRARPVQTLREEEPDLQQGSDPVCAFSEPRVHGRGFFCRKKRADGPLGESGPP